MAAARAQLAADLATAGCDRLRLPRQDACRLAAVIEDLLPWLDTRAREFWIASRFDNEEFPPAAGWAQAFSDLLAPAQVSSADAMAALDQCRRVAQQFHLDEWAACADSPDAFFDFAFERLLPPAPVACRLESAARAEVFLSGQTAGWCQRPFRHTVSPVELASQVLRAGGPLAFELPAMHAFLQCRMVPARLAPSAAYFEILARLEDHFILMFEAYRLGATRTAYLGELLDLFGNRAGPGSGVARELLAALDGACPVQ